MDLETNIEICNTKIRYSLRDDDVEEDSEVNSEEDKVLEDKVRRAEAHTRMTFDDNTNTIDMRKRKATDLRQNSKVFLPPPLNPILEAGLNIRKQELLNTFEDFSKEHCDDKGRQVKTSLTPEQSKGL